MCRLAHGKKPFPKAVVRHFVCENGKGGCVNPTHICWGTYKQNKDNSIAHGTHARGETSGQAKLDDPAVALIRAEYARGGKSYVVLAKEFEVSKATVGAVVRRKLWK